MPEPGAHPARVLLAAVLTPVAVAGIRLEIVHRDPVVARRLEALGPFVGGAGTAERVVRIEVRVDPELDDRALDEHGPGPGGAFSYRRGDLRFEMDPGRVAATAVVDGSAGSVEAVVELALQGALLPLGGFLVHGMAGVTEGEGWLVPGPSGAGKSTIAREAGFDRVLADEAVVVRRDGAGFRVWGTPFWSEGRPLPMQVDGAPLAVLARPVKAKAVAVAPWPAADAAAWLLRCSMLHEDTAEARRVVFELACDAAAAARCISLAFPKEGPWLSGAKPKPAA